MDFNFSLIPNDIFREIAISEIIERNEKTVEYGLILTKEAASELVQTRTNELTNTGRVEFGGATIQNIIDAFYDSPYINQYNYAQTLHELIEIFYYYKNETLDIISDNNLIYYMKSYFNGSCQGSLELLKNRELDELARKVRFSDFHFSEPNDISEFYYEVDYDEWE
ncbi:MAG: hypothetical protein A2Y17_03135 [Clostridiales bacterium GWF2_38_85]|nr:MAG: hypothetical protein A2Y17_03135 [Clostridiales bacterium GWF2_38_85]